MNRSDSQNISSDLLCAAFTAHNLCTRCGTCVGVCPENALVLDEAGYPQLVSPEKCTAEGVCRDVCPGAALCFMELAGLTFHGKPNDDGFDGHVISTQVGYAQDEKFRAGGAGGGVVTALLWDLLRNKEVDGCVVTGMSPERPWTAGPYIARTYTELVASQGSKYLVVPLNVILKEIRENEGRFAIAALPCHVHGLRKAMAFDPSLRKKISCIIGVFCGGALEPVIVTDMLRTKGIRKEEIQGFQFRGGEWPGRIRAIQNDGTVRDLHYSNYKDGAYNYFVGLYMPKRCQVCLDGSNLFADCAVSDAWTKNEYGEYKFKNCSRILVRTQCGMEVLERAASRGSITLIDLQKDANYKTQKLQTKRKGIVAPLRVARLGRQGVPVPVYDRETPDATWKERVTEVAVTTLLSFASKYGVRYYLIKFLTGKGAIPLIHFRLWMKNRKYKKRPG